MDQLPKVVGWSQVDTFALSLYHRMFCPGTAEVQTEVEKATTCPQLFGKQQNYTLSFCVLLIVIFKLLSFYPPRFDRVFMSE